MAAKKEVQKKEETKKPVVKAVKAWGEESLKLISLTHSKEDSTVTIVEALEVKNVGCLVVITKKYIGGGNSLLMSHTSTFMPTVRVVDTLDAKGKVIGRELKK